MVKVFQIRNYSFQKVKIEIIKKTNILTVGLTKAGYRKLTAKFIAILCAILFVTPFSVTTVLAAIDVIGIWGFTPGLGYLESILIYTFAIGFRKSLKILIFIKSIIIPKKRPKTVKT